MRKCETKLDVFIVYSFDDAVYYLSWDFWILMERRQDEQKPRISKQLFFYSCHNFTSRKEQFTEATVKSLFVFNYRGSPPVGLMWQDWFNSSIILSTDLFVNEDLIHLQFF